MLYCCGYGISSFPCISILAFVPSFSSMIMLQFSLIGLSFGIPSNFSWGPPYPSFIHVMCIDRQSSTDARQVLRELRTIGLRPAEIEEVEHDEKGETSEACILYYPPDRDPNPILETGLENWKFEDVLLKLDDMKFMKWVKFLWGGVFFVQSLKHVNSEPRIERSRNHKSCYHRTSKCSTGASFEVVSDI